MRLLTDTRYEFNGYHRSKAHCRLRIYGGDPDRPSVVIATEAEDNPGTSITNAAESLATRVCRDFGLDPDTVLWVEHYRDRAFYGGRPRVQKRFDSVTFDRAPDGPFPPPRMAAPDQGLRRTPHRTGHRGDQPPMIFDKT